MCKLNQNFCWQWKIIIGEQNSPIKILEIKQSLGYKILRSKCSIILKMNINLERIIATVQQTTVECNT
jgi:hypothetical protein